MIIVFYLFIFSPTIGNYTLSFFTSYVMKLNLRFKSFINLGLALLTNDRRYKLIKLSPSFYKYTQELIRNKSINVRRSILHIITYTHKDIIAHMRELRKLLYLFESYNQQRMTRGSDNFSLFVRHYRDEITVILIF